MIIDLTSTRTENDIREVKRTGVQPSQDIFKALFLAAAQRIDKQELFKGDASGPASYRFVYDKGYEHTFTCMENDELDKIFRPLSHSSVVDILCANIGGVS